MNGPVAAGERGKALVTVSAFLLSLVTVLVGGLLLVRVSRVNPMGLVSVLARNGLSLDRCMVTDVGKHGSMDGEAPRFLQRFRGATRMVEMTAPGYAVAIIGFDGKPDFAKFRRMVEAMRTEYNRMRDAGTGGIFPVAGLALGYPYAVVVRRDSESGDAMTAVRKAMPGAEVVDFPALVRPEPAQEY